MCRSPLAPCPLSHTSSNPLWVPLLPNPPPTFTCSAVFLSLYLSWCFPSLHPSFPLLSGWPGGGTRCWAAGGLGLWLWWTASTRERERERERERGQGNAAQFVVFFSQMAPLLCGWSPHCALMLYLSRFGSPSPLFPLHSFHVLSSSFSLFTLLIPLFL